MSTHTLLTVNLAGSANIYGVQYFLVSESIADPRDCAGSALIDGSTVTFRLHSSRPILTHSKSSSGRAADLPSTPAPIGSTTS
jgi:hypothetical protein